MRESFSAIWQRNGSTRQPRSPNDSESLATRPVTLTRARRCAHLAICGAAPLMGILVFVPVLVVLLPLLAQSPDAFLIDACLRRLVQLEDSSSAEATRERAAVEIFLVGRFRPLLTEQPQSRKPWFWPMIEIRQSTVQRALARQPNPSDVEIERAAQQLAGLIGAAQRNRELAARGLLGWRLTLVVVLLLIVAVCGAGAVVGVRRKRWRDLPIAGHCRRGPGRTRGVQVARIGPRADRVDTWHCRARAASAIRHSVVDRRGPVEQLAPSLLLLAVFVAGAVFALFNENHGLQDRIVRTSLVAR